MSIFSALDNFEIWKNFERINAIPRASKKEEQIIAFMVKFGNDLGLTTHQDEVGNVIIKKPATTGKENSPVVILQSHLDMVHQKNNDTQFDFDTQGIEMYIDGDWVKAKGTTLGADNGMGVAAIMTILESKDIAHPAIEALFTIDEETGMTGAKGLKGGLLDGSILLNLDTEDDNEITIGCAGGIDVTAIKHYIPEACNLEYTYKITVKGLNGGHSGMEIHKGLGNANKIMNRILHYINQQQPIQIASIDGGGLRNAIPRESVAIIASNENIETSFHVIKEIIANEFAAIEKNLIINIEKSDKKEQQILSEADTKLLINALYAAHNGVFRMSPSIENLVEASNNIAKVTVGNGIINIKCLTRSSVDSSKQDVINQLTASFEMMGAAVSTSGDYPGWSPNSNSNVLQKAKTCYQELFDDTPHVTACHAGLECGILSTHYNHLDMISFGPTILGAHSPEERVNITSVNKFWKLLLNILKEI